MLKVGITGGIGSGKSVVGRVFNTLGIPVFHADDAARELMHKDPAIVQAVTDLFGESVYTDGKLNREMVSAAIFNDPGKLKQLNAIVHPATIKYAKEWFASQAGHYAIKESAIFFESGSDHDVDIMIGVYAPEELRMQRAMKRSNLSREQVQAIMARQMDEDEKMKRCGYVIVNDDEKAVLPQVEQLHKILQLHA